ncbi:acyl-CoA thioesterase [Novosphingobium pentaromativorans]|uniref:Acyl-CoA thioesterase 2 n=1 Tax=Novosphingobium pentaromativorans US6-1 TaxID=1088721 RepID=G6EAN9_9SPHN|nr:acyl-CoA thioesterase II [Novosphingobium pentaromativorans]AIT80614.1 acyl-CoA thioesterase [Novosphingobium pentaromativorans US6-1]EHJ61676.1 acyl-CoA thioesterase II [Novosphingobium pentaromativorans US6-1]
MTDPRALAVEELRELLLVEEIDTDLFRGAAAAERPGRVFGGQVIAQALAAAAKDLRKGHHAHSLHAYFMRPGDTQRPIIYRVLRDFDGGTFANRRVVAMQGGKPILNLAASFQRPEDGFSHAAPMPEVLPPEQLPEMMDILRRKSAPMPPALQERLAAFDIRPGPPGPPVVDGVGLASQYLWFRLARPIGGDPAVHRIVLAYASDFALLTTAVLPQDIKFFSPQLQAASLDHAVWFHRTPPVDDWLLYHMDSPWAGHARGFARGTIYDRTGNMIASVAQEGLCRRRDQPPSET